MKRSTANILLLVGMGLGLLTGWLNLSFVNSIADVTSDLFLRLLRLISLPIIFLSVTATLTGMKSFQEMRKMGRKVLTYTLGTTIIAATIALILYVVIDPASRTQGLIPTESVPTQQGSYLSFVLNIIPSNFIGAFAEGNVMGIVFIAFILSMSILVLPEEQKGFLHKLFSGLFAAMIKLTGFIIAFMPIAIWAFITILVRDLGQNFSHFHSLLLYLSCVIGANLVQGIIVLPLLLKMKGISPLKSFKGMSQALTVAFFSKSSSATLPVSIRCAEKNLRVDPKISSFTLPLCSVVNMNGCAAFILTTTLFVSSAFGMTFSPLDLVGWIFLATFAAVGNAGVPMGCFFLTSAFLIGMDVPLNMMGLILPFYAIIDMIETTLNIWSDSVITLAVNKDLAPKSVPEQALAID
ncbi:MAG: Proton glutamate symport protein [Chlamydiae bacterium]|nr:Proton glutamate symport protein [Chlamydiota bacterium]